MEDATPAKPGGQAAPAAPATRSSAVVVVLALAGITASLTQTLVVPLIGDLPRILDTSASNASWVITATLLSAAVATPVAGRLGDLYGKRRMMLVSLLPLIVGSAVCALSSSLVPMIVGRGLQGLGMGMIPLGISLMRDVLPPERLGTSIALMSASMGVGGALGLPIAAAVAENASWRALFWSVSVIGLLVAALVVRLVPAGEERRAAPGRFDLPGALVLGAGLVSLLLAVSKGGDWGWGSGSTLGCFAAAAVLLLGWGWWELRLSEPLVDLRVTARPQVLLTNAASMMMGVSMYAQMLIVPQLLQLPEETGYGLGQSMLAMGLWMAPSGLTMMLVSPLGSRLSAARGPKFTLVAGGLVVAAGYAATAALMGSTVGLVIGSCLSTSGVGLAYGAMPALIMGAVPRSETASANSFNSLMRAVGTSVSAAVIGVVLAQLTTDFGGHELPSENGFRTGLLIGCGVALVAALIASAIPARRPGAQDPEETAPEPRPRAAV